MAILGFLINISYNYTGKFRGKEFKNRGDILDYIWTTYTLTDWSVTQLTITVLIDVPQLKKRSRSPAPWYISERWQAPRSTRKKNSEGIALRAMPSAQRGLEQLNKPAVPARLVNKPVKQA